MATTQISVRLHEGDEHGVELTLCSATTRMGLRRAIMKENAVEKYKDLANDDPVKITAVILMPDCIAGTVDPPPEIQNMTVDQFLDIPEAETNKWHIGVLTFNTHWIPVIQATPEEIEKKTTKRSHGSKRHSAA